MTTFGLVLVGLLMVVGICGVVIPLLPGVLLIAGVALWWASTDGATPAHWITFASIAMIASLGTVLKYAVPAKRTAESGASRSSMVFALALGLIGMVVIPIIGAPIGFVLGIYLAERRRLRSHALAWTSTRAALRGVALSMLIEFTSAVLMFGTWLVGVFVTR